MEGDKWIVRNYVSIVVNDLFKKLVKAMCKINYVV